MDHEEIPLLASFSHLESNRNN